jgi:hypothetical protein
LSRKDQLELSELICEKKKIQEAKGIVYNIDVLRALPAERTIIVAGARK